MYAALPHYILSMFASTLQSLLCFGSALPALLVSGVALFASAAALLQLFVPAVLALLSLSSIGKKIAHVQQAFALQSYKFIIVGTNNND